MPFSSLFVSLDVSKCEIRCQLVKGVADFIGLFNFEKHSHYKVGNIACTDVLRVFDGSSMNAIVPPFSCKIIKFNLGTSIQFVKAAKS